MKKILIFSFLALLTSFSVKNKVSAEQNTCQEFEETSSLNSKFKTKGIWNNDNWTAKEFEICNTSLGSKKDLKISYYNPTRNNRYVNSPSFNQKRIISPVFIPEEPDSRELGILLLSINEVRLKC